MSKPVVLTPEHAAFVDDVVAVGRHASAYELATLRTAWAEGVESGGYEPVENALQALAARYEAWETTGP